MKNQGEKKEKSQFLHFRSKIENHMCDEVNVLSQDAIFSQPLPPGSVQIRFLSEVLALLNCTFSLCLSKKTYKDFLHQLFIMLRNRQRNSAEELN